MTNDLSEMPDAELRALLLQSRQVLTALVQSLVDRLDMQEAVRRLMRPDGMLETFSELADQRSRLDAAGVAGLCGGAGECAERGSCGC